MIQFLRGTSRTDVAFAQSMNIQTGCDWVMADNAGGLEGLRLFSREGGSVTCLSKEDEVPTG